MYIFLFFMKVRNYSYNCLSNNILDTWGCLGNFCTLSCLFHPLLAGLCSRTLCFVSVSPSFNKSLCNIRASCCLSYNKSNLRMGLWFSSQFRQSWTFIFSWNCTSISWILVIFSLFKLSAKYYQDTFLWCQYRKTILDYKS